VQSIVLCFFSAVNVPSVGMIRAVA
jgi:hypothetical protein